MNAPLKSGVFHFSTFTPRKRDGEGGGPSVVGTVKVNSAMVAEIAHRVWGLDE